MAELLTLEKYHKATEPEPPLPFDELSDEDKEIREMWNASSREKQLEFINNAPEDVQLAIGNALESKFIPGDMPKGLGNARTLIKQYESVTSPEERLGFLHWKHPDYDFEMHNGRVFAKKIYGEDKGFEDWMPLDPEGITSVGEAVRDTVDIATDVAKGSAETLATIGGGIGGFAVGGPPGAFLGMTSAGGATGGAANVAMQKAAIEHGIRKRPVGIGEAGEEALWSAGASAIGGSGASKELLKNAAKKQVKDQMVKELTMGGIPEEIIGKVYRNAVPKTQRAMELGHRGLLEHGLSKGAKLVAPVMTGTNRELMGVAAQNLDEFRTIYTAAKKSDDQGAGILMDTYVKPVQKDIIKSMGDRQRQIGKTMGDIVKSIKEVNMSPVHAEIADVTEELLGVANAGWKSTASEETNSAIGKEILDNFFHKTFLDVDSTLPSALRATQSKLKTVYRQLDDLRPDMAMDPTDDIVDKFYALGKKREQLEGTYSTLYKQHKGTYKPFIGADTPEMKRVADALQEMDLLKPGFYYQALPSTVDGLSARELQDNLKILAKLKTADPGAQMSRTGIASANKLKNMGRLADQVAEQIDVASQGVSGKYAGGFKSYSDAYKKHKDLEQIVKPLMGGKRGDPQKTFNVLKNLYSSESKAAILDELVKGKSAKEASAIREAFKHTLETAKKIEAYRVWGTPLAGKNTILKPDAPDNLRRWSSRIAGMLAGGVASISGSGLGISPYILYPAGAAAGGAAMSLGTSPGMIRRIVDVRDAAKYLAPGGIMAGRTSWDLLDQEANNRLSGQTKEK